MAELIIKQVQIIENIKILNEFLKANGIIWSLITKILSGHKTVLERILNDETASNIHSIGDSRLSNLKHIKQIRPDIQTMYIKPPPMNLAKAIISNADISLNTSLRTINALNIEAQKQNKIHKIIIMIEMGELREGILRDKIIDFYYKIFNLSNIEVIGLGTNLGCMYGIEPTFDKLIQLVLYKELLEAKFEKKLELVSGGSSITLPLIEMKKIPAQMNHFRIGEAAFVGTSPFDNKKFLNLNTDTFEFAANIIELEQKDVAPDGIINNAAVGHIANNDNGSLITLETRKQAILDFGVLDVDVESLTPIENNIKFIGTTSDMSVYEITKANEQKTKLNIGDKINFNLTYMGVARLMNTRFIEKRIV